MISLKFKKVKCPVCDSKKFKKFNQKTRVSNFPTKIGLFNLKCFDVICDECSLVYSNPEPTAKSLKEYYSNKFLNKSLKKFLFLIISLISLEKYLLLK